MPAFLRGTQIDSQNLSYLRCLSIIVRDERWAAFTRTSDRMSRTGTCFAAGGQSGVEFLRLIERHYCLAGLIRGLGQGRRQNGLAVRALGRQSFARNHCCVLRQPIHPSRIASTRQAALGDEVPESSRTQAECGCRECHQVDGPASFGSAKRLPIS